MRYLPLLLLWLSVPAYATEYDLWAVSDEYNFESNSKILRANHGLRQLVTSSNCDNLTDVWDDFYFTAFVPGRIHKGKFNATSDVSFELNIWTSRTGGAEDSHVFHLYDQPNPVSTLCSPSQGELQGGNFHVARFTQTPSGL